MRPKRFSCFDRTKAKKEPDRVERKRDMDVIKASEGNPPVRALLQKRLMAVHSKLIRQAYKALYADLVHCNEDLTQAITRLRARHGPGVLRTTEVKCVTALKHVRIVV